MAIYWPTPGFKGRTLKLCIFTRWDFNLCVHSSPLRVCSTNKLSQLPMTRTAFNLARSLHVQVKKKVSVGGKTTQLYPPSCYDPLPPASRSWPSSQCCSGSLFECSAQHACSSRSVLPDQQCQWTWDTVHKTAEKSLQSFSIPSNSEWVVPLAQVILGLWEPKLGWGRKKTDKNAHILTVNTAVLPSLSDTISLSSAPIYSESSIHPSSGVINFMLPVIIHEKSKSNASENLSFFDYPSYLHQFQHQHNAIPFIGRKCQFQHHHNAIPFIGRKCILKLVSVCLCFQRSKTHKTLKECFLNAF